MYGIYANIWGILMVNVTIYGIHGSYGFFDSPSGDFPIGKINEKNNLQQIETTLATAHQRPLVNLRGAQLGVNFNAAGD